MENVSKKHLMLKILLALLPAVVFNINYGMMSGGGAGWAFFLIWALVVWSVWEFTEKNHIMERFFRLTEIGFFLLPLSAIILSFVLGAKAVGSTTDNAAQAGAAIGTAIGGTFITVLCFIFGVILGVIFHLITSKYEKKAEASAEKQAETFSNKHGVVMALLGVFAITIIFGSMAAAKGVVKDNSVPLKSGATANTAAAPTDAPKVDMEIVKKDFTQDAYGFQKQITMDFKFTNNTGKAVKGVEGAVTYYDIFDHQIKSMNLTYDEGIPVGGSKVYHAGTDYNQFIDSDTKLKDTDLKSLKYKWVLKTIVYDDGTKDVL